MVTVTKRIMSVVLALVLTIAFMPTLVWSSAVPQAHAAANIEMQRLYNPNSGEHFYTASTFERDHLVSVGWNHEGVGWTAPETSNTPVFRLYNANAGDHHYTTSEVERNHLIDVGWDDEGIGWYSDDAQGVALHRQYNPNAVAGSHNYTTSEVERDHLIGVGWNDEGIAWYGVNTEATVTPDPKPVPDPTPVPTPVPTPDPTPDPTPTPDPGPTPTPSESEQVVAKVKQYSYVVKPVNGKLNNIFFVETDNPDPYSFQFVDSSSKYLEDDETALIKPVPWSYADVVYTNDGTRRIANKGYLFYNAGCDTDGGTLELKANIGYSYTETDYGSSYSDGTNYDTGLTVTCPALEDRPDYLLRTYASGKSGFFDKLDAVQDGLNSIALYPKRVLDTGKPNASGYPSLASSPYPELGLNKHIENMYEKGDALLISDCYGFVLDSLGVPGMMGSVAKRLQPNCEVSSGLTHAYSNVTYNGVTKTYGGAGAGSTYPIYTKFVSKTFKFDGTDRGYGTNLSLDTLRAKRLEYAAKSDEFANSALAKLSHESVAKVVGDGAWINIAREGYFGGGRTIGYATYACDGTVDYASDAWVDGRYVNSLERYQPDAKFSDHPTADIILHGVTYTDRLGTTHTTSVTYRYESDGDYWQAFYYYTGNYWYDPSDADKISASLKLTRAQVDAMVKAGEIDGSTSVIPTTKYIYDGTAEPGTPCR